MAQTVKRKMRRPYKTSNTALGARLEEAIQQTWGSHRALAEHTGIKTGTITKYVRHGRLPAGEIMVKLAQALPGQIDYILTGVRPTDLDQQRVGTLPPPLRRLIHTAITLSTDLQHTLEMLAKLFTLGEHTQTAQGLQKVIQSFDNLLQVTTEVPRNAPITPENGPLN